MASQAKRDTGLSSHIILFLDHIVHLDSCVDQ